MYAPCYFLCMFLSVSSALGMDVEKKPTFNVLDGIRLAHQFYAKRDIYQKKEPCFGSLPNEMQHRIMAQVHPRQTVDAYFSDDVICVGEKKLPHKIYNFAVQHDSLAYVRQTRSNIFYAVHHMNLAKFVDNDVSLVDAVSADAPNVGLCSDNVLYQNSDEHIVKTNKYSCYATSVLLCDTKGGSIRVSCIACHASLPFCVSIGNDRVLRMHNVETKKLEHERDVRYFFGDPHDDLYAIAWHPTQPIFAVSKNGWILISSLNKLRCGDGDNFEGKPCFSYDGNKIWGQSNSKLRVIAGTNEYLPQHCKEELSKDKKSIIINNAAIESVGDDYALTRDNNAEHPFSLHSLHDAAAKKEIKSLSGLKGKLCRLPDNHDYRLFVIDEVTDPSDVSSSVHSVITIYVPNSRARMEHYCLFNAALEAEKTERAIDWNLFKKADQKLLQQTAEHYSYFKTLMNNKKLL